MQSRPPPPLSCLPPRSTSVSDRCTPLASSALHTISCEATRSFLLHNSKPAATFLAWICPLLDRPMHAASWTHQPTSAHGFCSCRSQRRFMICFQHASSPAWLLPVFMPSQLHDVHFRPPHRVQSKHRHTANLVDLHNSLSRSATMLQASRMCPHNAPYTIADRHRPCMLSRRTPATHARVGRYSLHERAPSSINDQKHAATRSHIRA